MANLEKSPFPAMNTSLRIMPTELRERRGIDMRDRVGTFVAEEIPRTLGGITLSSEKLDVLLLLATEVLGNGDRPEEGRHATEVVVGIGDTATKLYVAVGDDSPSDPNIHTDTTRPPEGESGKGLMLVNTLATEAGYTPAEDANSPTRKWVWFGLDLAA